MKPKEFAGFALAAATGVIVAGAVLNAAKSLPAVGEVAKVSRRGFVD